MSKPRPTRDATALLAIARLAENLSALLPAARQHLNDLRLGVTGYPSSSGGEHVQATNELTSVEAAAAQLEHWARIDSDLLAGLNLLRITIGDMIDVCHQTLRGAGLQAPKPRLCDPSGHEGAMVPIADGGWADPTCRDIVDANGLCTRCRARKYRWTKKHEMGQAA